MAGHGPRILTDPQLDQQDPADPAGHLTNIIDRLEEARPPCAASSDARTTLAVITPRGAKVATEATRDLNETVYECIGLSEPNGTARRSAR